MSKRLNIKIIKLLSVLLALLMAPISNADKYPYTDYAFTPFAGFRISDSLEDELMEETIDVDETSSFGFILSMRRDRLATYDLYFSRQDTAIIPRSAGVAGTPLDIRIDYFHLGGTVDYEVDKLRPFATGGLGIARISPANDIFGTETKFSFSLGGGVKVPITEKVGLRFEARALGITTSGDRRVLCANGQCVAQFEGSLFLQFEASVGLSIAF
ncbi:MAG: outer membrane beta-barrel protein [Gammaproteobacteria bacterium]|nr:outer membrane beta-barrel protein [Gammaproteobacteria bacterium]